MLSTPASMPAYAILRERIRNEILAGDWAPGTHRTLATLAAQHGVSLSPVREALLGLEGEGLIQMRQHRGAVVPLMDAALVADLYDVRGALQSVLARRAAERGSAEAIAAMADHLEAYAAAGRAFDAAAALVANDAFHNAIEDAAGNTQASALYRARSAFVNTVRFRLGFGPARMAAADAEHRAIHAAIAARQPEAAAAAAFAHAMGAKDDLLKRM